MARNVKHIMRDDLDIVTVEILDHIFSCICRTKAQQPRSLQARACQEGFTCYRNWQGLTIEREIHPLTLEEGTAEIDHYHQEIHGNHIPFKLPMGLHKSLAAYLEHCQ